MNTTLLKRLNKADSRSRGLMLLLLFTLPLGWKEFTNFWLLLYLLHSLFTLKHWQWREAFRNPVVWASLLFFAWHALSLIWSAHVVKGLFQLESKMSFLLFPLLIVAQRKIWTARTSRWAAGAFVAGNVLVLVLALGESLYKVLREGSLQLLSPGGTYRRFAFTYEELASPFMHPGYLALHIGMALIILLVWWAKNNLPLGKYKTAALAAFLFLGLVLIQGRAALLAFLIVMGVASAVWLVKQNGRRGLPWLLVPLLLLALVIYGAPRQIKNRYLAFPNFEYNISGSDFNSATYRLAEWRCAWQAIAKTPVAGVGAGSNWPALKKSYRELEFWEGITHQYNAHNQYLETTLIGGVIGLLLLLLWMAVYLREALRMKHTVLLLTVLFFAITIITESMLERAWAIILVNVWWPFLVLLPPPEAAASEQRKTGRKKS